MVDAIYPRKWRFETYNFRTNTFPFAEDQDGYARRYAFPADSQQYQQVASFVEQEIKRKKKHGGDEFLIDPRFMARRIASKFGLRRGNTLYSTLYLIMSQMEDLTAEFGFRDTRGGKHFSALVFRCTQQGNNGSGEE